MKILMVSSDFPPDIGGIATHVYELSTALVKRGHTVTVASVWWNYNPLKVDISYHEGITVHRINGFIKLGPWLIRARRYLLRRYIEQLVKTQKFDIVHVHGQAWAPYATKHLQLPMIGTIHSNRFVAKMKSARSQKCLIRNLSHLSRITAPCTQFSEAVNKLRLPCGPCIFIPNGVNTTEFRMSATESLSQWPFDPKKNKVILCACRIFRVKGIIYLVKAIPKIIEQYPNALVIFAGSENPVYKKEIQDYIKKTSIEKYCIFLGAVPNEQMPSLMKLAHVSVLPSLEEATSITALESMAMGLPIVATTVGGLPELITHNIHGLLVLPEDPSALAEAIIKLLSNPNLAHNLGEAALKRAQTEFDWSIIAQRFEKIYQSVL